MKFWSILKDSFREAIDCKVMYVTVGLSCLVFLIVASVSYTPMPAEKTLEYLVSGEMNRLVAPTIGEPPPDDAPPFGVPFKGPYRLQSLRVVSGASDSPDSEYAIVVQRRYANAEAAGKARANLEAELDNLKKHLSPAQWNLLEVANAKLSSSPPVGVQDAERSLFFELTTRPTAATRRMWAHEPAIGFGTFPIRALTLPLGLLLHGLSSLVLYFGSLGTILISVIITAFFIPNMLRKGTIDLLLAKPIARWLLLSYKYLGGLIFIFLNTSFTVVGIWLILGLRSGVWANSFLLMIFVITFFFAILYAVSTLFAVWTRSAVVAILVTCAAWFWFFLVGTVNQVIVMQDQLAEAKNVPEEERPTSGNFAKVVKAIHFVTPRTRDLDLLGDRILLNDFMTGDITEFAKIKKADAITWESSISVSLAFIAIVLGLACWRFAVKDY